MKRMKPNNMFEIVPSGTDRGMFFISSAGIKTFEYKQAYELLNELGNIDQYKEQLKVAKKALKDCKSIHPGAICDFVNKILEQLEEKN